MSSPAKHGDRNRLNFGELRNFVEIPRLLSPLPADPCFNGQSVHSNDGNQFKDPLLPLDCVGAVVDDISIRVKNRVKILRELRRFYRLPKLLRPFKAESNKDNRSRSKAAKKSGKASRVSKSIKSKSVKNVVRTLSIEDIRPFYGLPRLLSPLSSDSEVDDDHLLQSSTFPKINTTTVEVIIESDVRTLFHDLRKKKEWDLRRRKEDEFKKEATLVPESKAPERNYEDLKEEVFGFILPSKPLEVPEPEPEPVKTECVSAKVEKKVYRTQKEVDEIYSNGLLGKSVKNLLKIVTKNKPVVEANSGLTKSGNVRPSKAVEVFKNPKKTFSTTSSQKSLVSLKTSTSSLAHRIITNLNNVPKCVQSSCNSSETYSQPPSPFPLLSPGTPSSLYTSGSSISTSETTSLSNRTNSSVRRQRVITAEMISRRLLKKQIVHNNPLHIEPNYSDYISDYRNRVNPKVISNGQQFIKEKVMNWNVNYENILTPPTPMNIPDDFETPPSSPKMTSEALASTFDTKKNETQDQALTHIINTFDVYNNCGLPTPDETEESAFLNTITDVELNNYFDSIEAECSEVNNQMDAEFEFMV